MSGEPIMNEVARRTLIEAAGAIGAAMLPAGATLESAREPAAAIQSTRPSIASPSEYRILEPRSELADGDVKDPQAPKRAAGLGFIKVLRDLKGLCPGRADFGKSHLSCNTSDCPARPRDSPSPGPAQCWRRRSRDRWCPSQLCRHRHRNGAHDDYPHGVADGEEPSGTMRR
jgi:hypothetical protein